MNWDVIIFGSLIVLIIVLFVIVLKVKSGKIQKTDCDDKWHDDYVDKLLD